MKHTLLEEVEVEIDETSTSIEDNVEILTQLQVVPLQLVKEAAYMKYTMECGLFQSIRAVLKSMFTQGVWPKNPFPLLLYQLLGSSIM